MERYTVKVVGELWSGGRGATTYADIGTRDYFSSAEDLRRHVGGDFARILDYEVTRVRVSGDWTREVTEREVVREWDDPESEDFFAEDFGEENPLAELDRFMEPGAGGGK